MQNQVIIMLDTDKVENIQIGKSNPIPPSSMEELAKVMLLDVGTICEALVVLIRECAKLGIKSESDSLNACIKHLEDGVFDAKSNTDTRIKIQ
jgi:hypothetical protein